LPQYALVALMLAFLMAWFGASLNV